MKALRRIEFLLFLFAQLGLCGIAQAGSSGSGDSRIIGGPPGIGVFGGGQIAQPQFPGRNNAASSTYGTPQAAPLSLDSPYSVAIDRTGTLYISDPAEWLIYRITKAGVFSEPIEIKRRNTNSEAGKEVKIASLSGIAVDPSGNLYFTDSFGSGIYKVGTNDSFTRVAGTERSGYSGDGGPATEAQLKYPIGITFDSAGNLYFADSDNHRIRRITPAGVISTVAGKESAGYSGDGGPATASSLNYPTGVTVDSAGNLYIADSGNHRIRKIAIDGKISTVAGNGNQGASKDYNRLQATAAQLNRPVGIAVDTAGNLYITDTGNSQICKVTTRGFISVMPVATGFPLRKPSGITVDSAGNLYVADPGTHSVRRGDLQGIISTIAGNYRAKPMNHFPEKLLAIQPPSMGTGISTVAQQNTAAGVTVNSASDLYIAYRTLHQIRKRTFTGKITTIAGTGVPGFSGDGGPATEAKLNNPTSVEVDVAGNLYIIDAGNRRIRKVTPEGIISTVAGNGNSGFSGDGGPATEVSIIYPKGLAIDSKGNLYFAESGTDRIRKVTPEGIISTAAGDGNTGFGGDGGQATAAKLNRPSDVAIDTAGNLLIADAGNKRIRKVTPSGKISTIFENENQQSIPRIVYLTSVAVDSAGGIYFTDTGMLQIHRLATKGFGAGTITMIAEPNARDFSGIVSLKYGTKLCTPSDVAVDVAGNLYVVFSDSNNILLVTKNGGVTWIEGK